MRLQNKISILMMAIFSSCATPGPRSGHKNLTYRDFSDLALGSSISQSTALLGRPDEVARDTLGQTQFTYLNAPDGYQIGVLGFDTSRALYVKGYLPPQDQPQVDFDALIQKEFKDQKFEEIEVPRCGLDMYYWPISVNRSSGVTISRTDSKTTESIFWVSQKYLPQFLKGATSCHSKAK